LEKIKIKKIKKAASATAVNLTEKGKKVCSCKLKVYRFHFN